MRSAAIGFWIGAGSRDERDTKAGISHFMEHLLFKGSRSYTAQEIAEIFDSLGGELNAATSREHTVVYARVADQHLETAVDVMTDMVFAPVFAELDAEREVVLEEIAMYEDTPQDLVHDLVSQAVFGPHALGRPVIGSADTVSALTKPSLAAFHRAVYVPGNIVVAAAGKLDHDRLTELLQQAAAKRPDAPARKQLRTYTDSGQIGVYVGTREENLAACLEIVAAEIADIAAGNLREAELDRAKENLKGRMMLAMESTSNRMSRLGKSVITDTELLSLDRLGAEIDAVGPEALAELAGVLLASERLSAAGIGPSEKRFGTAVERVNPALALAA